MFVGGGGDNSDDGDTANWLSIYDVPAMHHSKHSNPITSTLTATPTKKGTTASYSGLQRSKLSSGGVSYFRIDPYKMQYVSERTLLTLLLVGKSTKT